MRALAVFAAALVLCWPAFLNGFPLLFVDSYEYLYTGWGVWKKLLGRPVAWGAYASTRSEMYSAGIFVIDSVRHRGTMLWGIVAVQAVLAAWVLWLLVRSVRVRWALPVYLALVVLLSILSDVGWFVSYIMPDILGPLLYLCAYLLVFAADDLSGWETAGLAAIIWWATGAHTSHLIVSVGLCCLLGLLWLVRWQPMRRRGAGLLKVAAAVLLAVATQMAVHQRLYGTPSLVGAAPPFLMARLLGDGPARTYLQLHCASLNWMICTHVNDLPTTDWGMMWTPTSIWMTSTPEQKLHLQGEQVPLAIATLRAYPREQLARTWSNFMHMLTTTGPWDFDAYPIFSPDKLNFMAYGSSAGYARSSQAIDGMPQVLFEAVQRKAVQASVLIVAGLLLLTSRRRNARLFGLALVIAFVVCANAFVGGAFSGPYPRYQVRVLWLLPLLAGLIAIANKPAEEAAGALHE